MHYIFSSDNILNIFNNIFYYFLYSFVGKRTKFRFIYFHYILFYVGSLAGSETRVFVGIWGLIAGVRLITRVRILWSFDPGSCVVGSASFGFHSFIPSNPTLPVDALPKISFYSERNCVDNDPSYLAITWSLTQLADRLYRLQEFVRSRNAAELA